MSKVFWGIVGGCMLAFFILLGMFLKNIEAVGAESAPETVTAEEFAGSG